MGHIFGFITCTRVKWEATITELAENDGRSVDDVRAEWDGDTDYSPESDSVRLEDPWEESGWIDCAWSPTVLQDSRNDVRPVVDVDESDTETLADEVRDALGWLEGGYEDNGDGTFYASGSRSPMDEPWTYSYALHFVRKSLGPEGYVETAWHPVRDGGITL
jgi:hypothetical protein